MTDRIHPSDLQEPYDLHDVKRMIDSWRGTPQSKVPRAVKLIAWMYEGMMEMASFNEHLSTEVRALENYIDRKARDMQQWPDSVARDAEREAMQQAHKDALRIFHQIERAENREQIDQLLAPAKAGAGDSTTGHNGNVCGPAPDPEG